MIINCLVEHSFSQLKQKFHQNNYATRQTGCLISTKYISDVLHKIKFEDQIKDFATKEVGEDFSNINKVEVYKNKHYFFHLTVSFVHFKHKILFYGLLLFIF